MSFIRIVRKPTLNLRYAQPTFLIPRNYSTEPTQKEKETKPKSETPKSSCEANTVLSGLNYLKNQPPVIALPDEEYPDWLWTLLQPLEADGDPDSPASKKLRRKERKANLRYANFMKTQ